MSRFVIDGPLFVTVGHDQDPGIISIYVRRILQYGLIKERLVGTHAFSLSWRRCIEIFELITSLALIVALFCARPTCLVTFLAKHGPFCVVNWVIFYGHVLVIIAKLIASLIL